MLCLFYFLKPQPLKLTSLSPKITVRASKEHWSNLESYERELKKSFEESFEIGFKGEFQKEPLALKVSFQEASGWTEKEL